MTLAIDPGAWDPATWSAVGSWATAAVYAALLVYAARQVKEAQSLREEQARPFVVVDFDVNWLVELRIENTGHTVARNVTMSFKPELKSTLPKPWAWEDSVLFDKGIPTLAPGKAILVPFDSYLSREEQKLNETYAVVVKYQGHKKRPYEDTYILDLSIYEGTAPPAKGMPELVDTVDKLRRDLGKWTDGIRGLRVHVVNRDKHTRRDDRHYWIDRAKAVRSEKGNAEFLRYLVRRALQRRGCVR